ncbi:amidohydrolase family protein [Sphingomonas sp. LY160]|uniref:amidohydrolase family protein n=1 Tax=Sphingomonas sp. LY160 TaxID=3095342 RepID=UPI002ADEB4E5|nr:amidohydrolase family protein [Sphingomonas sp. LY160]MEA1070993.1 amidohydrolase family protein [Sphingomonas sp. LY160]
MNRLLLLTAALLGSASPLAAQTVAITNGIVATGDGSDPVQGATVIVRNGRVTAVGQGIAVPADAEVIDASGKWVTPGIVAGFSRLGLAEVDLGADGSDDTETGGSPFSAAIDVAPAINPLASTIAVSRADGVTRAIVAPVAGRSIFGGQGAVIDTGSDMNPILRARAFQFVEMGESGAAKAGGSRASTFVLFRNALREARNLGGGGETISGRARDPQPQTDDVPYEEQQDPRLLGADIRRGDDALLNRFDAAALVPVVRGRQLLLVHVERAVDILNVLSLRREFPSLRIALVGVSEGWTVADRIAASGVWVIASALNDLPASFEMLAATQSNVGRMQRAGVKVAIGMIDDNDTRYVRNQRQYAGNLVGLSKVPGAAGLSWGEAFAMISSRPAEAVGVGREIGTLAAGRRGDVVIWSGDPLELASAPEAVWIDGVRQPLENHQSKLRDRYRSLERGVLPEVYRK